MTPPLQSCFDEYAKRIGVQPSDTAAAASHRASIKQKLEARYGQIGFFRSGSFGNGTAVSGHSDVDYFAVIDRRHLRADSNKVLAEVAELLRERFPRTGVRVDRPGVRLPFGVGGDELTEIIPVDEVGKTPAGFRQFDMPDGDGGWMFAAPESHNAYVTEHDKRLSGQLKRLKRLKRLIRIVKAWKFVNNIAIRSFYLEMFVTQYAKSEHIILYEIDLLNIFMALKDQRLPDIVDPQFPKLDRKLEPCKTVVQWSDSLKAVEQAATRASEAQDAKFAGNIKGSYAIWDRLFQYNLPPLKA